MDVVAYIIHTCIYITNTYILTRKANLRIQSVLDNTVFGTHDIEPLISEVCKYSIRRSVCRSGELASSVFARIKRGKVLIWEKGTFVRVLSYLHVEGTMGKMTYLLI